MLTVASNIYRQLPLNTAPLDAVPLVTGIYHIGYHFPPLRSTSAKWR
jgi:hypothetical protein